MMRLNKILRDLWPEFIVRVEVPHLPGHTISLCGLCGNHGKIHLTVPAPPCGYAAGFVPPQLDHFCICPNGRVMKRRADKATARKNEALKGLLPDPKA
jgi:hypothetical protein